MMKVKQAGQTKDWAVEQKAPETKNAQKRKRLPEGIWEGFEIALDFLIHVFAKFFDDLF